MFADENGRCLAAQCKNPAYMAVLNRAEEAQNTTDVT